MDAAEHAASETHRIVLVEDSPNDEWLSKKGILGSGAQCSVEVIRHGGEALYLLLSPKWPVPCFILLDFHLPGMNGLEIVRGLRQTERMFSVPIVVFSSQISNADLKACLAAGANSVVQKSTDSNQYVEDVMKLTRYWTNHDKNPDLTGEFLNGRVPVNYRPSL